MKKLTKEFQAKSVKEMDTEIVKLREDIAKSQLESKVNPAKDTNSLFKKRKKLARLLTGLKDKKELEMLKK